MLVFYLSPAVKEFGALQQGWHYKDEKTGARVGPVDQEEISRLIAEGRLERATVVWNPEMADWAKASTTGLAGLFGCSPPPLPAAEISRWALFAVALFPIWGTVIQAAISSQTANPREVFDQPAWLKQPFRLA